MHSIGLIFEANPYHNGHRHLILEAKRKFPDAIIICVTSTSFTMRGEISLIDKFTKTQILLNEGVDLVFELPISYTLQSADYFSKTAVQILSRLGVKDIIVGAELPDLSYLEKFAKVYDSDEFQSIFQNYLSLKLSYKKTIAKVLQNFKFTEQEIEIFNLPNMTLAFQYYRTIQKLSLPITLHMIQRTTSFYDTSLDTTNFSSATNIRKLYQNKESYAQFLPYPYSFIDINQAEDTLFQFIQYQFLIYPSYFPNTSINGNSEGIMNYINERITTSENYSMLINQLKNKRYSSSRIRRVLLSSLIHIHKLTQKEFELCYLRLLGFTSNGKNYLSTLPKETKLKIFSSYTDAKEHLDIQTLIQSELLATKLYGLLTKQSTLYLKEFKLPMKKEG